MAIVIGSKFNPFSMQEMLAPAQMATEEHNLVEQQLGELSSKASAIKSFITDKDEDVLTTYDKYNKDLSSQASNLLDQGLTPNVRQELINMRNRYGQEILPIEQAASTKRSLIEEQRKYKMANPSAIMSTDISQVPLSDIINNPNITYDVAVGDDVTKRVAQSISPYAKLMLSSPGDFKKISGGQFLERVLTRGLSTKDVMDAMKGEGPEVIKNIVQSAIQDTGVSNWSDPKALDIVTNYANRGITAGLGDAQVQLQDNFDYKLQMQDYYSKKGQEVESTTNDLPFIGYREDILDYSKEPEEVYRKELFDKVATNRGKRVTFEDSKGVKHNITPLEASKRLLTKQEELDRINKRLDNLKTEEYKKYESVNKSNTDSKYYYPTSSSTLVPTSTTSGVMSKAPKTLYKDYSQADSLLKEISNLNKEITSLDRVSVKSGDVINNKNIYNVLTEKFGDNNFKNMTDTELYNYLQNNYRESPTTVNSTRLNITTQGKEWQPYNEQLVKEAVTTFSRKFESDVSPNMWEIDPTNFKKKDKLSSKEAKNAFDDIEKSKKDDGLYSKVVEFTINPQAYQDSKTPIIIAQLGGKLFAIEAQEFGSSFNNILKPYWESAIDNYKIGDNKEALVVTNEGINKALNSLLVTKPRPGGTNKDSGFNFQ